jgi:hypothetical protein
MESSTKYGELRRIWKNGEMNGEWRRSWRMEKSMENGEEFEE